MEDMEACLPVAGFADVAVSPQKNTAVLVMLDK
jgi:hypothetical protein